MYDRLLAQGIENPVLPPILGSGGPAQGGIAAGELISNLVSLIFIIAFIVSFIYLLTGAIYWITSGGDKANLESARNRIIHAILGLIVVAAAWAIATLVADFLCLDINRLPIPVIGQRDPIRCSQSSIAPSSPSRPSGSGNCSYARNGEYACYSLTQCVQCVNGQTVFNVDARNCAGMACGR